MRQTHSMAEISTSPIPTQGLSHIHSNFPAASKHHSKPGESVDVRARLQKRKVTTSRFLILGDAVRFEQSRCCCPNSDWIARIRGLPEINVG
jgi:hypothetical protein